jgi:hypothetical protein
LNFSAMIASGSGGRAGDPPVVIPLQALDRVRSALIDVGNVALITVRSRRMKPARWVVAGCVDAGGAQLF